MIDYASVLNPTVAEMKPSGIRKFFDIAATMDDVISLGVGEPDFQTPWAIRKTGIASLERGKTKYTSNSGILRLREEICVYLNRKYGLSYDPATEVLLSVGGSEAIDCAIRALVSAGDEVIIPQPSYVCYEPITALAGGVPVIIETKAEDDFKLTVNDLRAAITPRTKAIILPYPCNPTGAIMEKRDLEAIADLIRDTNIIVISDEIYSELTFGQRHVSPATIEGMSERTITINGFSKTFSMTGWRLGYACGPKELIRQMTKIHQFAIMCAPTTSQYAAIEAMHSCDEAVADMIEEYNHRRRLVVSMLNDAGFACREPKGAFYAFPSIRASGLFSDEFCERLLLEEHVAVVPGTAFGRGGEGFVRISYCYSKEHLIEAIGRMETFLGKIKHGMVG